MNDVELRTLAPEYNADYHGTYVSRLNAAVEDPRNRNIALTGRYGSGKSSILDQFLSRQGAKAAEEDKSDRPKKTLRISINTLGPDDGEDLTNRIQKELVKQLVYRAKPGTLRTSRFARLPALTWWRAAIDAFIVAGALVGLLWLFGLRPDENALGTENYLLPMITLCTLAFLVLWGVRWHLGRRTVSQFSTGGASVTFEESTDSYFDKYLDELVAFFEATEPEIVVFEDLDRFDDPQIFDSLRELNTLLNASSHWIGRPDRPVRFVYAIKDSLFEKLGDGQQLKDAAGKPADDDASTLVDVTAGAAALATGSPGTPDEASRAQAVPVKKKDAAEIAIQRANRTKFFEIVIPVVPFLSHSNARDHFLDVLRRLRLPADTMIDRGLIDVVARHTTDMRLMTNIGNEFVVYAERLLWVDRPAPGLDADRLFALVVYKNFHLADFEALPHRGSVLDKLEQRRRDLIDASIETLQTKRADILRGLDRQRRQTHQAALLGERLAIMLKAAGTTLREAAAGGSQLSIDAISEASFWRPVGQTGQLTLTLRHSRSGYESATTFEHSKLRLLFIEASDANDWLDELSPLEIDRLAVIDEKISELRGVSFANLARDDRHEYKGETFGASVNQILLSDLARDLVKQGYLDRYYAEYATVFYGEFLGVDVANFFRNSVWPNEMNVHFAFTTENAVKNVLEQAPAHFLRTRSALNVEIVDHVVSAGPPRAGDLVDFLAKQNNRDTRGFLTSYFNTPASRREELIALLAAKPWPDLFNFLALDDTLDDDETRKRLLSAGLMNAGAGGSHDLNENARAVIARLHPEIKAFSEDQPGVSPDVLFSILVTALPSIQSLRKLSPQLQKLAVTSKRYELSIDNIRAAVALDDDSPISAENLVHEPAVWAYCAENVAGYLRLVDGDARTLSSCSSSEVLSDVVNAEYETWTPALLGDFIAASSPDAALSHITVVAQDTWPLVVGKRRVDPSLPNIAAYAAKIGVDSALATLLVSPDGKVISIEDLEDATCEQMEPLIPRLLNTKAVLTPAQRVSLVAQLMASQARPGLDLTEIEATPDALLAELLQARLIQDRREAFEHFSSASWPSIGPALRVSANAAEFIAPALISGHAAEVVTDSRVPETTRRAVLERLSEFAPTENAGFLAAAGGAARTLRVKLNESDLRAVAPTAQNSEDVLWQLSQHGPALAVVTVLQILSFLPGGFTGFSERSGYEFEIPDSASLASVLDRLKTDGAIEFPRGRPYGKRKVRIA